LIKTTDTQDHLVWDPVCSAIWCSVWTLYDNYL